MRSLTAHLLEPGGHGRLPFHPGCPVCCQERLAGTLTTEPVVPRRAQAALAAGLLALSAAPAPAAYAQDEGADIPQQTDDDGFDPGGEAPLPGEETAPPGPTVTGGDDDAEGAPVEAEPEERPLAAPPAPPAPDSAVPPPAPLPAPPNGGPAPDGTPPTVAPEPSPPVRGKERQRRETSPGQVHSRDRRGQPPSDRGLVVPPGDVGPPATPSPSQSRPVDPPVPQGASGGSTAPTNWPSATDTAPDTAHTHVVRPGESLWSIAQNQLGSRATPAAVARLVNRLWELNEERIGTGEPDLVMVGTVLRLP